jgi:hypothetical protein
MSEDDNRIPDDEDVAQELKYDVFLAYNSKDEVAVRSARAVYEALKEHGKTAYFDEVHSPDSAGELVPRIMESAIKASRRCAVLLGEQGFGRWQGAFEEVVATMIAVERPEEFRLFAVLLPGADESRLPLNLQMRGRIALLKEDLSDDGLTADGLGKVFRSIGLKPEDLASPGAGAAIGAAPVNRALLVGVGEYADDTLQNLNGPANDVPLLEKALDEARMRGGGRWQIQALPLHPDFKTLADALQEFFQAEDTRGGTVFFYYSGHGVVAGDAYLCAADTRRDTLSWTAISARQIVDLVKRCTADAKVIVLDCCHGAPIGVNAYDELGDDVAVVLASLGPTDDAKVAEPSPFTRNLVDVVRDSRTYADDGLTVGALVDELERRNEEPTTNKNFGRDILLAAARARPEQAPRDADGEVALVKISAEHVKDDRVILLRQLAATLDGLLAVAQKEADIPSSVVSESMHVLADELMHIAAPQLDGLHELVEAAAARFATCQVRFADSTARERLSGLPWELLALCDSPDVHRRQDVLSDPRVAVERLFGVTGTKSAAVSVKKVALLSSLVPASDGKSSVLTSQTQEQLEKNGIAVEAVAPASWDTVWSATPDADVVALQTPVRLVEAGVSLQFANDSWKRAQSVGTQLGQRRNLTCLLIETVADAWSDVPALGVRLLAGDLASRLERPVIAVCHPRAYLDCIAGEPKAATFLAELLRKMNAQVPLGRAASEARKSVLDSLGGDPAVVGLPIVLQPVPREERSHRPKAQARSA